MNGIFRLLEFMEVHRAYVRVIARGGQRTSGGRLNAYVV